MAAVVSRPRVSSADAISARVPSVSPRARATSVLWWRWLPWTAPRLTLGRNVSPQTRLEVALCALFRCQASWSARQLVERLAQAPAGSDDSLAVLGSTGLRHIGRGAAWIAVCDWLESGTLLELEPPLRKTSSRASARPSRVAQAESRVLTARFPR